jgi:ATP-dependent protease HslVU (ClpYQ) peptidase subunit
MTCIAGIAHEGTVWLAGDSAVSSDWDLTILASAKVCANGPYVLGFTGSLRMAQLLRYSLSPPVPGTADLHEFVCTAFIDAVRACLKDGGWATKDKEQEEGGTFLVGVRGRLFVVSNDYGVTEPVDSYAAIGCGDQLALGALFATADNPDQSVRLRIALSAAERFSNGVRGPFTFVHA